MLSPRYSELTTVRLPEVDLLDGEAFNHHLGQVIDGALPGFVMRQTAVYTESGQVDNEATVNNTLGQVGAGIIMGERKEVFDFKDQVAGLYRQRLHSDKNKAPRLATQVSIYIPLQGVIDTELVPFLPSKQARIARGRIAPGRRYMPSLADQTRFRRDNEVRSAWFEPVSYSATLKPGDELIFSDALTAHSFSTVLAPRWSTGNVFHARRNQAA